MHTTFIEDWLLNEEDAPLFGKAAKEVLRSLINEIPSEM
jgi:hypothetical protein